MNRITMTTETQAWVKRSYGAGEIIRIVPDTASGETINTYQLFNAFEADPEYLGMILFDEQNYWIYDGNSFTVNEQEQLAQFIIAHGQPPKVPRDAFSFFQYLKEN